MKLPKVRMTRSTVLAIAILVIVAIVIISSNAADWRELYCQANPINCIRKGW